MLAAMEQIELANAIPTALVLNPAIVKDYPYWDLLAFWMQTAYQVFIACQGAENQTAMPNLSGRQLKEFYAPFPSVSSASSWRALKLCKGSCEACRRLRTTLEKN